MGKKILIVQTGFIGDVILSTQVIGALAKKFPNARLYFLTTPVSLDLVKYHPNLTKALVFDKRSSKKGAKGLVKMAKELRKYSFDMVFSLHKSYRTSLLLKLSNIPLRYGFKEAKGSFFYTKTTKRSNFNHEVLRNLSILKTIEIEPKEENAKMHIEISREAEETLSSYWKPKEGVSVVSVSFGSVWNTKRWTVDGFTKVIKEILDSGAEVLLIGGPKETQIAKHIERRLDKKVFNLVGKLSLLASVAAIKKSDVLLTNDSSPMHMASAVKTPVVSVWCATVPEFGYTPWQVKSRIHEVKNLSCRPCGTHGHNYCPTNTHKCQLEIDPFEVVKSIFDFLPKGN